MARYDLESLLSDLKAVCVANLNTKLTSIATEKGDSVSVPAINDAAYFFQILDFTAAGVWPVFLYYGAEDPTADSVGAHTAEDYNIFFVVVMRDTADGELMNTKMLRYSRALKEIFEQAFVENKIRVRISVTSITPLAIGDSETTFRSVGVKVGAILA